MRVLALADIHDEEVVLEKLQPMGKGGYDYVLIAGDSTRKSTSFVADILGIFPDAYIIPGNSEQANSLEILRKAKNYAHGKRFGLKEGYNIVGFGFSNPTPFGTPGEMKEDEIYEGLLKLKIDEKTILLVHAPPYGVLDEIKGVHIGSKAVRRIIEEKRPFLVFCAHLHETMGSEKLGKTLVVKIPAGENGKCCEAEIKGGSVEVKFREL